MTPVDNNTSPVEPESDLDRIKGDLQSLYTNVAAALDKKGDEAKDRWEETKVALEGKRRTLEARAEELRESGSAASADLKAGFDSASSALKSAIQDARSKFGS